MRLTSSELDAVRTCAKQHFGEKCIVRLFGSRVDDARRGGDIDLHIEAATPEMASLQHELEFLVALKDIIGEQRIDVVLRAPNQPPRAIDLIAKQTGIRL